MNFRSNSFITTCYKFESDLSFLVIRLLNLLQFFISYIMTVIINGIELTTNCFALSGIFTFKSERVDSNHRTCQGADLQSAAIATMRRSD